MDADDRLPLAYFISFRCYGTWLHGDERGSTDRHHNVYGTPFIPSNKRWRQHNERLLRQPPVSLDAARRTAVETAIRETCEKRRWLLMALNARTNHVHSVVSAACKPEPVLNALKANATRQMREMKCWTSDLSPWSYGGSRRYLWTERSVELAVDYVLHGQGDDLPDFDV